MFESLVFHASYLQQLLLMSFLFKINGVENEKTTKIIMILNFVQAGCSWFEFIGCIMIGNIKQRTKDYLGSISDTTQKTYNPVLALFSIIGILQALFGIFIGLAVMGKLPFLQSKKRFWFSIIHYGLLVQFGFVCFICLYASTSSTIFAATNDTQISQFSSQSSSDASYAYNQSFVVYARYLSGWAVLQFLICLPISIANLYAIHTRHINYEALTFESEEMQSVMHPGLPQASIKNDPTLTVGNSSIKGTNYYPTQRLDAGPPLESPKPLQVQMIPK